MKGMITLKKKALALLLILFVMFGASGCKSQTSKTDKPNITPVKMRELPIGERSDDPRLSGMELISTNSGYSLFLDRTTSHFAVLDIKANEVFYSNPQDADADALASEDIAKQLKSIVRLSYLDADQNSIDMLSFTECVEKEQIEYGAVENGIRILLSFGREAQTELVPQIIPADRYEWIRDELSSSDATSMGYYYSLHSLEKTEDEELRKEWLEKFPIIKERDIYVIAHNISDREKLDIERMLKEIGYTEEMLSGDNGLLKSGEKAVKFPFFKIPLDIVLTEDGLTASIDTSLVSYDEKGFPLTKIWMLEYFGAGKCGQEGYMLVPDGSGAVIEFNNDKKKDMPLLSSKLYGLDSAIAPPAVNSASARSAHMPVFGTKTKDTAVLGIISEGDAMAEIVAESGNIIHSYNSAFPVFTMASSDEFSFQDVDQKGWTIVDANRYKGKLTVHYSFLKGEDAEYTGMAKKYQSYLEKTGAIKKQQNKQPKVMSIGALGVIDGILDTSSKTALTKFKEAQSMVEYFNKHGIDNIALQYKGWANGGLSAKASNRVSVEGILGGSKGFKELAAFMKKSRNTLYPDMDFLFLKKTGIFDGYDSKKDSSKMLDKSVLRLAPYSLATNMLEKTDKSFAVSPSRISAQYKSFNKQYDKFGPGSLGVSSLGSYLYSDFDRKAPINREQSKEKSVQLLKAAGETRLLLTESGNAYAYPYVDFISGMPSTSSNYRQYDYSVPFMQLVLHGYIDYSGVPINLASDMQTEFLRCMENGAALNFTLAYKNIEKLSESSYSKYYAVDYNGLKDTIVKFAQSSKDVYKKTAGMSILNHTRLADNVYKTQYENKISVIVNYSKEPFLYNGAAVNSGDFICVEE